MYFFLSILGADGRCNAQGLPDFLSAVFFFFFFFFSCPFFIWYLLISGRGALAREGLGKFSWSAPVAEDCVAAPRLVGKVV